MRGGEEGRLIELLEEKWTALITRAVTKGLEAECPDEGLGSSNWFGDSGAIGWGSGSGIFGEAIIGLTYEQTLSDQDDQGVLVLRASNVADGHIVLEDKQVFR